MSGGVAAAGAAFLVLRGGGATWALPYGDVRRLARRAGGGSSGANGGFEVVVDGGTLAADEVLGVVSNLRLHPAGAALRRFWPEAAGGLAVHREMPLMVIDPQAPPRQLLAPKTEHRGASTDGE